VAVDKYGFSAIAINSLGIGNSSHADPVNSDGLVLQGFSRNELPSPKLPHLGTSPTQEKPNQCISVTHSSANVFETAITAFLSNQTSVNATQLTQFMNEYELSYLVAGVNMSGVINMNLPYGYLT
jgi:hypothetical protein